MKRSWMRTILDMTFKNDLIEYEKYKAIAEHLGELPQFGDQIRLNFEHQRLAPDYEDVEAPLEGDPASLVILYEQMLRKLSERKPPVKVEAKMHLVTVEEKIEELSKLLTTVNFALFQGFYKNFKSRYELVVYALAALELSKYGNAKLYQQTINGPLWIYSRNFDASKLPISPKNDSAEEASLVTENVQADTVEVSDI